jgi:hypothetical protein
MKTVILNSTLAMILTSAAFAQTGEVGKPAENQQDRIAQGVKSGSLGAGQTARLETKEAAVNHEVRADRRANGGKLTAGEKAQVNRQQNHLSRQIYKAKHS